MPHVRPADRPALIDWMARTGRDIPADASYVHESTWAEHLADRVEKPHRDDAS